MRAGCSFYAVVTPTGGTPWNATWRSLHRLTDGDRRYYDAHPVAVVVPAAPHGPWNGKERHWTEALATSLGFILVRPRTTNQLPVIPRLVVDPRLDAARARKAARHPKPKRRKQA